MVQDVVVIDVLMTESLFLEQKMKRIVLNGLLLRKVIKLVLRKQMRTLGSSVNS